MKTISDIALLRSELDHLVSLTSTYSSSFTAGASPELAVDPEFYRLWDLFKDLRVRLFALDNNAFARVRELSKPEPDKSNSYVINGVITPAMFRPLVNELNLLRKLFLAYEDSSIEVGQNVDAVSILHLLTSKFHTLARELSDRHDSRPSFTLDDEYDVQDFLRVLLNLYFDDIRKESWAPSYAGASGSRVDFLLKKERIIVEVKRSRPSMNAKKLGEELIIDIDRYKGHPDCDLIFCFVYDPEARISNPRGLENDLSGPRETLNVIVSIVPKN